MRAPPRRWQDGPGDRDEPPAVAEARRLLRPAGEVEEWPPGARERLWRRIAESAENRGARSSSWTWTWTWAWAWTGLSVAAAAAALLLWLRPQHPPLAPAAPARMAAAGPAKAAQPDTIHVDLGAVGTIELAAGARYRLPGRPAPGVAGGAAGSTETRVYLEAGELAADIVHQADRRFVVLTPEVRVLDVGTRFTVDVASGATTVSVAEGEVRVEALAGGAVDLRAGESLRSDDARLRPEARNGTRPSLAARQAAVLEAPQSAPSLAGFCPQPGLAERRACFERLAQGGGLEAEDALYALGLLERNEAHDGAAALASWREYERRFPDGVLAEEAAVGALSELLAEQRYLEARQEAEGYLTRFPDGLRAAEVRLVRANLLCESLGEPEEALAAYDDVLRRPAARALRDEALFAKGLCQDGEGRHEDAVATWRAYLAEFPGGSHVAEVARLLAPPAP